LNNIGNAALTKFEQRGFAGSFFLQNGRFGEMLRFMVNNPYFFGRLFASNCEAK
jgi:hypothetical protein